MAWFLLSCTLNGTGLPLKGCLVYTVCVLTTRFYC
jgi:hypothetical protein